MGMPPGWDPSKDPMMQTMGFRRVVEVDAKNARYVVEFEARPEQCHSGGVVQGGFVSGWIDNAMATAAMLSSGFEKVAMSLDLKIAFYRAANPGPVIAEGWVERAGKRTVFAEGLLRTVDGEVIAKGMSTIAMRPVGKPGDETWSEASGQ